MFDRSILLEDAIKGIELSPTMKKNAIDKYNAISTYLDDNNIKADFYPQGSFLFGTVIRPYREGKDHNYDLDILCILDEDKKNTTPNAVKNSVGDCLKNNKIYLDKLKKEDKNCWTLEYAEIADGVGFSLDLVPSVHEEFINKQALINLGVESDEVGKLCSITNKNNIGYDWLMSNPLGYGKWFKKISDKFLSVSMIQNQKQNLYENFSAIFEKAEEIPDFYYKSNLQRAVQILKRTRDIYYDRAGLKNMKPSSIALTTLVADCVKDHQDLSVEEIIKLFIVNFKNREISCICDSKIVNPANPNDNFANNWSTKNWGLMNKWLRQLDEYILIPLDENLLNSNINNFFDLNDYEDNKSNVVKKHIIPIKPIVPTKHWGL
jgi:hypothetical protein